jgi:hypothetical protein
MAFIESCPNCGLSRDKWQGEDGKGYTKERVMSPVKCVKGSVAPSP